MHCAFCVHAFSQPAREPAEGAARWLLWSPVPIEHIRWLWVGALPVAVAP